MKKKIRFHFWLLSISAIALLEVSIASAGSPAAGSSEWNLIGNNPEQQHYSSLAQINEDTVKNLGLAWVEDMPVKDGSTGVPLIDEGIIYQSAALGKVFAHDLGTGKLAWSFDAQIKFPMGIIPSWGSRLTRGLALWEDLVITATGDCRLIALDKKTGQQRWQASACDPDKSYTITGAPRVGGGKVFIGNANADSGANRGHVNAFDAGTGEFLWRFYIIPGDPAEGFENKAMEMASKTWGEEYWKKVGGGSPWDAMTYDPKLDLLYVGTDAPFPLDPTMRGAGAGDELFTNAIVALDASTGEYRWHYFTTPGDAWNYAATMHIMIADLNIQGMKQRVVMAAPKNGFFYVLNAESGKLLSAENIVPVNWASHIDINTGRPVKLKDAEWWLKGEEGALVVPGPMGAHNWMPMSYNQETGLVYIPVMEAPMLMTPKKESLVGGVDVHFYYAHENNLPFHGSLLAWNPVEQKEYWRKKIGLPYQGGILSTAGNLVFQGSSEGHFAVYHAMTGEKLWSMFVGSGIIAAPSTVEVDGEQVIVVPAGSGTSSSIGTMPRLAADIAGPARLLAFKLGGQARVPVHQPVDNQIPKPGRPRSTFEQVKHGEGIWLASGCEVCHGYRVIAAPGSSVPDLRKSTENTHKLYAGIVLGGLYASRGMPAFGDYISMKDLEALQDYIINEAWNGYEEQQKANQPGK